MENIDTFLKEKLMSAGADLVGYGDLQELPPEVRCHLPRGVSVAVKYPKEVIRGIVNLPTKEYYDYYNLLNKRLDMLVMLGAETLLKMGYQAIPQTLKYVGSYENNYMTLLPHKTVATRAGLGWIGKNALLITNEYGSMVRISSIITDAPLNVENPINTSKCGDCTACTEACSAQAITGEKWSVGVDREMLVDVISCRETARSRALKSFGVDGTICGKCIEICPYTQAYLRKDT